MTTHQAPLPAGPFTLAMSRAAGLPFHRYRHPTLHRPTRGVRMVEPPTTLLERARAIHLVLPESAAFSHVTAAQFHGLPLSYAVEADDRLHVTRPIDQAHIKRDGVVGHRALHPRSITKVDGLPVVDLADTWVDFGELVGRGKPVGLDDLIVLGDACATRLGSKAPLDLALTRRIRPRGKNTLTEALVSIRVGSLSAPETQCRLMFTRAGLPEPRPNVPIVASWDPHVLLGIGDLVWEIALPDGRVLKVVGEYQGEEFHSSDEQKQHDKIRNTGLRDDGWVVIEIWKRDMNTPEARAATITRFAAELEVDPALLDFDAAEPRFFSRHTIDLAIQRQMRWAARG